MLKNLWNDEAGFTVALELVLVAVILVIGLVTGLTAQGLAGDVTRKTE